MEQHHRELIMLIVSYSLAIAFVFTVALTCLSLGGWFNFADPKQQKHLFKVLIVELVIGCLGFFFNFLNFSPNQTLRNVQEETISAHGALIMLVNLSFDQKRDMIDTWIENKYLPLYISTVRAKLAERKFDPNSLDEPLTIAILQRIMRKRNEMQTQLEESRADLLDRLQSNSDLLTGVDNQLAILLKSGIKSRDITPAIVAALKNASGGKIDLQQEDRKFNEYLEKAGDISQKATNLYDELQPAINK